MAVGTETSCMLLVAAINSSDAGFNVKTEPCYRRTNDLQTNYTAGCAGVVVLGLHRSVDRIHTQHHCRPAIMEMLEFDS
ncbi:hypothetical protein NC653_034399 [Populus alba x Populus x berolinensis]|uniref:Uncharacterized protein n=1 Tax=Populus alba x Populus x berolinensis TaxID=444605 RepID=A0AAD6PX26_9ROSI|nr:hypothetical protein NC653_034399 [Populus alba x Populus x berolinensis]